MAEQWTQAFGRYLRTLRDRRSLSLQDVASLSQPFAEQITKGYLSRCENGRVRLALSKVAALGHIYKVSAEVLLERIDLDMELDRVGSPETEGMSFAELREAGEKAANDGYRWHAYGYFRDRVVRAATDPVEDKYRDREEQLACAVLSCSSVAVLLGRTRFALHEFQHVESSDAVGARFLPLVLERLATAYRRVGELERARDYADRAISAAEEPDGRNYLGFAFSARALQSLADSDRATAAVFTQRSYEAFKESGRVADCARELSNLAQIYFDLGRFGAARRALVATETTLKSAGQHHRHRALARILLGEIEALEQRNDAAEKRWKEAAQIARQLNDKTLQFKAEYQLLRHARNLGNEPAARSIQRRLAKLSNYVPDSTPELRDFQELVAQSETTS